MITLTFSCHQQIHQRSLSHPFLHHTYKIDFPRTIKLWFCNKKWLLWAIWHLTEWTSRYYFCYLTWEAYFELSGCVINTALWVACETTSQSVTVWCGISGLVSLVLIFSKTTENAVTVQSDDYVQIVNELFLELCHHKTNHATSWSQPDRTVSHTEHYSIPLG